MTYLSVKSRVWFPKVLIYTGKFFFNEFRITRKLTYVCISKKICLHYPGTTLSIKELKSVNNVLLLVIKMLSFDNRNAKRGRFMMLLLFHDVNIGFPLVLIVLEAFYEHSVTNTSVPISSTSSTFIIWLFWCPLIGLSPESKVIVNPYSYDSTNKVSSSNFSL